MEKIKICLLWACLILVVAEMVLIAYDLGKDFQHTEDNKDLAVNMAVACYRGCQHIPRTNGTQLYTCYDYCKES
jgi:hypothetical protein